MRDSMYRESVGSFYADDGLLESTDPLGLQTDLDIILDLFEKMGLKANAFKTKCMILRGTHAPKPFPKVVYNRVYGRE